MSWLFPRESEEKNVHSNDSNRHEICPKWHLYFRSCHISCHISYPLSPPTDDGLFKMVATTSMWIFVKFWAWRSQYCLTNKGAITPQAKQSKVLRYFEIPCRKPLSNTCSFHSASKQSKVYQFASIHRRSNVRSFNWLRMLGKQESFNQFHVLLYFCVTIWRSKMKRSTHSLMFAHKMKSCKCPNAWSLDCQNDTAWNAFGVKAPEEIMTNNYAGHDVNSITRKYVIVSQFVLC